jgi:hypothetical protein
LLWPSGHSEGISSTLGEQAFEDLRMPEVVAAIVSGTDARPGILQRRERFARDVLAALASDHDVIRHRQSVLADLVDNPPVRERLEQVLPSLEALAEWPRAERYRPTATTQPGLEAVARRLGDLELLVDAVSGLAAALETTSITSDGLQSLRTSIAEMRDTSEFASLERELPGLRAQLASVRSVTIGVNLGPDMTPESATILDLGTTPVDGRRGLLFRLLGGDSEKRGLTPLQRGEGGPLGRPNDLVRDLRHLLAEVVAPVRAALEQFARVSTDALGQLGPELALLLGEARLVERLRSAGLPMTPAELLDSDQRQTELTDLYDLALALTQSDVVTSDARFDEHAGRVWVLTGPNRGGKTTYTRAVGLAQVLCQVGMYVPARSAHMSPVDALFTHFPTSEDPRTGTGRLDAEAVRLALIFKRATPRSLILLNEALSGTSAIEALDIARGLVRGLRLLGARAIYVTHLHELAASVDEINATTQGDGTVGSLLADSVRQFQIAPGPPTGKSFAAEIAEQHGISFGQLAALLRERNLV